MVSDYSNLSVDASLADTVITVGHKANAKSFEIVGAIFAMKIDYFKRMLFGRFQESRQPLDNAPARLPRLSVQPSKWPPYETR